MPTAKELVECSGEWVYENDNSRYRLEVEYDQHTIFGEDDGDWYGEIKWCSNRNEYGYHTRPPTFDGAAMIIERERNVVLWWQPPKDTTDISSLERHVRALRNEGYSLVIVTHQVQCPCCKEWTEQGRAVIGGVDLTDWKNREAELTFQVEDMLTWDEFNEQQGKETQWDLTTD